jgi:putative heme iron utilization protein
VSAGPQENHRVPVAARERTGRTLAATTGLRGEPTDAERSRTLLAQVGSGSLATMSIEQPGYPFGSLVAYAVSDDGMPLLCLSDLAEHSRNVAADPRASLMVTQSDDSADPLSLARVTVLGEIAVVGAGERDEVLARYTDAHPGAFYATFDDFRLYRLRVGSVRYVGGFGRMSWVDAAEYAAAEPDPLRPHAGRILEHMNADHADALVAYCRAFGAEPATESAEMVGVDRYGFDILAVDGPGVAPRAVRLLFDEPIGTVDAVRAAMVTLLRRARAELGIADTPGAADDLPATR